MKKHSLIIAALASGLLVACAQQPTEEHPHEPEPEPRHAPDTWEAGVTPQIPQLKAPTRPFTSETLYALLAAELAGSRERFDIALANYVQQAHQTRDPQVAARATHIARFLNAEKEALDAALLWVDIVPHDTEAQINAALALLQNGRLQEAFAMSRKLHAQGEPTLFQNIAASAAEATDIQRETLLSSYKQLLNEYPNHQELLVGTGLLAHQLGQPEEALTYARRALARSPRSTGAALLETNILYQLGQYNEAVKRIESALEHQPDSLRLRLQYARLLTQKDLGKSQEQFEILVDKAPQDPDLRLSLGIVSMERGDLSTAKQSFDALLDLGEHVSPAHYYLAQMAERDDDLDQAVLHYLQVQPGGDFLSATVDLLDIFMRQNDPESADEHMNRLRNRFPDQAEGLYLLQVRALTEHQRHDTAEALLDRALHTYPTSSDLLYARAMLYIGQDRLQETKQDLRQILTYDPNNAAALNALGYTMADNNLNLDEAEELIRKALALMPDDPAILDSMGWVLYRQGNPKEALPYLQRAMDAYPDQEIAAHLGEVLWVLGEREKAREAWNKGLEEDPDSELIPATKKRLGVPE
ncbi:tetratricopeptide repeat protein [Marinimicrobium sp. ABcell2]|uniref:tetratricopeptide repeat protein n=1 Tax=Marinimicrobium sp. ABcell2 TaxID=3069751 RepID=UPI0027B53076|nr:tetratricopeptide repeat protein [Marinimicrobium sp. ABcell2]MDQ2077640.1 tetratricopeptide repeat protein [Marinimicrobium sp. ABcell2]